MVYCTNCGTKNEEAAVYCIKCGAKLVSKKESWDKRMEKWGEDFGRQAEKECFGLPHGGMIFGLLIGLIIILVGLSSLLSGFEATRLFWPLLIIVFGVLIAVGALYSFTRRR